MTPPKVFAFVRFVTVLCILSLVETVFYLHFEKVINRMNSAVVPANQVKVAECSRHPAVSQKITAKLNLYLDVEEKVELHTKILAIKLYAIYLF